MRNDNRKAEIIAFAVFVVPLIYMGLKIAPYMSNGLISILNSFGEIFAQPFKITLCEDSVKAVLILLLIYGITLLVYFSSRKITDEVKNMALPNGAKQNRLAKSIFKSR